MGVTGNIVSGSFRDGEGVEFPFGFRRAAIGDCHIELSPFLRGVVRPRRHGSAKFVNQLQTRNTNEGTAMKHKILVVTFLSVVAFTVGCDKTETTSQQLDKVQEKTADAAQEMKDYTFAQKAEFTAKMQSQLEAINKDLDQLAVKIEKSSASAKAEARPKLQALREQAEQLGRQLDEARNATESTWESVKAGSKKAYNELKDGFNQARQWVSDKIAP